MNRVELPTFLDTRPETPRQKLPCYGEAQCDPGRVTDRTYERRISLHAVRSVLCLALASLIVLSACGGGSSTGPLAPPPPAPPPPEPGLSVRTRTTGDDLDLSAYVVRVAQEQRRIERDETVTITPFPTGNHTVRLDDVAENCSVNGGATRQVSVTAGTTAVVSFDVSCTALPPARVDVTGTWSGPMTVGGAANYIISYELEQDGDEVTASTIRYHNEASGITRTYSGVGRVSDSTLTLFFLGLEVNGDRQKVTANLDVSGDQMTGNDTEQLGLWAATMTLSRQ